MIGNLNDYTTLLSNIRKNVQPKIVGKRESDYMKLCNKRTTTERTTTDVGVTGIGMANIVSDGGISAFDAPVQGFTKIYTQMQAQKNVALTYQTYFFLIKNGTTQDISSAVAKKLLDIEKSIEDMKDYMFQSMLQNGFNTSFTFTPLNGGTPTVVSTTTADALEYWSQSHLIENGSGTFSTVIVDGATNSPILSMSAIEAAHRLQGLKTDGTGIALNTALDTVIVRRNSLAHQEAKRIKADLDRGYYPATTPGTNGSFQEAARVPSFSIIDLMPFPTGSTGLSGLSWGMADMKMKGDEYGFQYIEAMPTTIEEIPGQLNRDYVIGGDALFVFGASDVRPYMWSMGDGSTV